MRFLILTLLLVAVAVLWLAARARRKTTPTVADETDADPWFTEDDAKKISLGLFHRHWLDQEALVKVYGPAQLAKYFDAKFDSNGDVIELANRDCVVRGFASSFAQLDGHLNRPELLRRRLGMDGASYDAEYGGDLYVIVFDGSDLNLRFDFPTRSDSGNLEAFEEGGSTAGGAREIRIETEAALYERIIEVRRVCSKGYGRPFTPQTASKHSAWKWQRKSSETGEPEEWNPWHDEGPDAWAIALITLREPDPAERS